MVGIEWLSEKITGSQFHSFNSPIDGTEGRQNDDGNSRLMAAIERCEARSLIGLARAIQSLEHIKPGQDR